MTSSAVALLAVLVSLLSIIISYRNQRLTLATSRAIAWAAKEADYRRSQMDALREEIAEFCFLAYEKRSRRTKAELAGTRFRADEDNAQLEDKFEVVFHRLLLRLDPRDQPQSELLAKVIRLGAIENTGDYTNARNEVLVAARDLFEHLWGLAELKHSNVV